MTGSAAECQVEEFAKGCRPDMDRLLTEDPLTYISKLESAGTAPGIDLVEKLAKALGVGLDDLIPIAHPADHSAVSREMARDLFDTLLKKADQQTFALLNPFLAMLVESSSKRS